MAMSPQRGGIERLSVSGMGSGDTALSPSSDCMDTVGLGGGIAQSLERVAPVAEAVRPVGLELELPCLHLGAVLCALEVAHLRHDPVDGPVEAGDLRVQAVHEAPQQGLALVGELGSLDGADAALELSDAYARGEVEAPEALVAWLMARLEALARSEAGAGLSALDEEIERVRQAADEDDHDLYCVVDKWLDMFPARRKAGVVRHIAGRTEDFGGRLALYWLLDPVADVRLAAAGGVNGRVNMRIAEPESLSVVPLVRKWMPADAARGLVDAALREARRRGLFAPLAGVPERAVRFLASLPDRLGEQEMAAVSEVDGGPVLALATTRTGQGVGQAAVVRGEYAREGIAGLENARDTFELPRECVELLLSAGLAEGFESGRLAPAGLIDVAVACGLAELRPRAMTVQDWLGEVDPESEIASLEPADRELLVEESAAWPDRHPAVEAWSEGTAIYREALGETPSGERTEEAFWARMEERREGWALTMLRGAAYVLKSAGDGEWRSFAATATALLDGRTFKTIPAMDRIYAETIFAMLRESVGRLSEDDDGKMELARLIAAAAWPEDGEAVATSIWLDGYLAAGVLAPSGAGPDALYSAAVEWFSEGGGPGSESFSTRMANRFEELVGLYGESHAVAAMLLKADDIGMTEWARGFAQGVRIMEVAWPTDLFVPEERRMVSLLAGLAEGELSDLDACADVATFIEWRWQARYGSGVS